MQILGKAVQYLGFELQLAALVGSKRCGCLLPRSKAASCEWQRLEPSWGICRLQLAGPWHYVVLAHECVQQPLMSVLAHNVDWSSWAAGTSVFCAALASGASVASCATAASSAAVLSFAATSCSRAYYASAGVMSRFMLCHTDGNPLLPSPKQKELTCCC